MTCLVERMHALPCGRWKCERENLNLEDIRKETVCEHVPGSTWWDCCCVDVRVFVRPEEFMMGLIVPLDVVELSSTNQSVREPLVPVRHS